MEKKLYMKPQLEAVRIGAMQLLSGSGVESDDDVYDIDYGGTDGDGNIDPQ